MRATATKNRGAARKNVGRRPSTQVLAKMEQTIAALPDLAGAVQGKVGDVEFDDANTFQGSRCQALTDGGNVYVEIEIYPKEISRAFVALHFGGYQADANARQHLEIKPNELEPLAVALSRAVANARARGFLPTAGAAT
jgi:hypothetical protein